MICADYVVARGLLLAPFIGPGVTYLGFRGEGRSRAFSRLRCRDAFLLDKSMYHTHMHVLLRLKSILFKLLIREIQSIWWGYFLHGKKKPLADDECGETWGLFVLCCVSCRALSSS
ncbi:hypothetical protein BDV12DRAFT_22463 [Aspergillus spectabilis]